ncbi:hypothetical protein [Fructilactobacillus frigidiflavus]|uniref:hypothetical protein n=1 Tax=Fructilactobacillus frigidiflavus TaxID=3242688 RepID=UPI003756CF81
MGKIKDELKKNKFIYDQYKSWESNRKLTKHYKFVNRSNNKQKLCIILAGYKEFLWDDTLGRIYNFIPDDYDVCLVSSGLFSNKLDEFSRKNKWSYVSVKRNNVALAQNVAISLFPNATDILKIDEDIFITDGMVRKLEETFDRVKDYDTGIVSPTIPINGFGYNKILDFYNLTDIYKEKFENPIYAAGPKYMIESNPEVAKFFWGKGGYLKQLDKINSDFLNTKFNYSACPIRLSIGCILFKRDLWNSMKMFDVSYRGSDMGRDEEQIDSYCMLNSRAIIVSGNAVAGHLSFGTQNNPMKSFFLKNKVNFNV